MRAKVPDQKTDDFTAVDSERMAQALSLARRGVYTAHPNPRVGCVVVRDGEIVGSGWHVEAGREHAEVIALREAGDAAKGAVVYVTLEPCSHHGKTPPCCEQLIAAEVGEVVVAMQDPFAEVAGRGLKALREAGIRVRLGLMQLAAASLNEGFVSRIERSRFRSVWRLMRRATAVHLHEPAVLLSTDYGRPPLPYNHPGCTPL